jgi:predicted kinase
MLDLSGIVSNIQNSNTALYILCGFPYSGKSFISAQIQKQTNIHVVTIDDVFKSKGFSWDTNELPSSSDWNQIFSEVFEDIRANLVNGKNVLFDSTNQTLASRNTLRDIALSVGVETKVIYIKTSVETVWQRWEENKNNPKRSVVSREFVQQTIDMFEEPTEDENVSMIYN